MLHDQRLQVRVEVFVSPRRSGEKARMTSSIEILS